MLLVCYSVGFPFHSFSLQCIVPNPSGRIGVKPLRSNALLLAQKKNGRAVINETSLKHFDSNGGKLPSSALARRSASPSKSSSSGKGKEKGSARNSDDEEEDSGDEAEKLNDEQMNELDQIYRKYVVSAAERTMILSPGEPSLMSHRRAQQGDTRLDEMDPPDTFLYMLRPYQKQALTWMNAREAGDETVRDQGLHPLWEE
jgi:DNA repair protein RAD5